MASVSWKEEYELLNRFITEHPEIVLNSTEISIPKEVRDEFYLRFDDIRMAVVEKYYSSLSMDIDSLCNNYQRIEQEIIELLRLENIVMPMDLSSFLHKPKEGLTRVIYNRLFDLLQKKINSENFDNQCIADLDSAAARLFRLGYEWWAALSIIKLLDPDEAYQVELDPDDKPFPSELKSISFGRQAHHPTIRIPEFIVHSRKLDNYIGVKMALTLEVETYVVPFKPPVRPKKRTGDTSLVLDSRVMILSYLASPRDIPIIADIYERTLNSPDWTIEFSTMGEIRDPNEYSSVQLRVDSLKPNGGSCVILMDPDPESAPKQISEKIHPFAVGMDKDNLLPVLNYIHLGG
jgi:hypothetical protein